MKLAITKDTKNNYLQVLGACAVIAARVRDFKEQFEKD